MLSSPKPRRTFLPPSSFLHGCFGRLRSKEKGMRLRHILAATDESEAGRRAVRAAVDLASRASARVTVLRVLATEASGRLVSAGSSVPENRPGDAACSHLHRWLEAGVLTPREISAVELAIAAGIPGVEICRVAELAGVDLIVLGRKRHSPMMRMLLGDTADAVARRSRFPSLFVPSGSSVIQRLLVALDGSDRGTNVLNQACNFALAVVADLQAVTVERTPANEPLQLVSALPVARSVSLKTRMEAVLKQKGLPAGPLAIRRGDIVERIVAEAQETQADVLVVGYHRGGPPGVIEAGSTARRLVHASPCAVLTIPL